MHGRPQSLIVLDFQSWMGGLLNRRGGGVAVGRIDNGCVAIRGRSQEPSASGSTRAEFDGLAGADTEEIQLNPSKSNQIQVEERAMQRFEGGPSDPLRRSRLVKVRQGNDFQTKHDSEQIGAFGIKVDRGGRVCK